jgi:hypothetical protein
MLMSLKETDYPPEDLDLFLDTHGWKNEPISKREKIKYDIFSLILFPLRVRHPNLPVSVKETRERLERMRSALNDAADQLDPSEGDLIDLIASAMLKKKNQGLDTKELAAHLRTIADLCADTGLSLGKLKGGSDKDLVGRLFASRCWHFLKKWHAKPKITKKYFEEFTKDLWALRAGEQKPGLDNAIEDAWTAHRKYEAGQTSHLDDVRDWFLTGTKIFEP